MIAAILRHPATRFVLRECGAGPDPRRWRMPPIETWPGAIAFVQTPGGQVALLLAATALLKPLSGLWLPLALALATLTFAPAYRRPLLVVWAAIFLVLDRNWFNFLGPVAASDRQGDLLEGREMELLRAGALLACVPLAAAVLWLARRYRDHPLGRRPILVLHLLFFALLAVAAAELLPGFLQLSLWAVIACFAAYFWFLAYAVMDYRARQPVPLPLQFAMFRPFWGSSLVPIGKGWGNARRLEAGNAEELAITQLKGLKLLAWAFVLKAIAWVATRIVHGKLGIPSLAIAFGEFLDGKEIAFPQGALSVVANFFLTVLGMAVWGHVIVATARLAGFRLLRNTYRPLSARSIAEFWNRYFYYFKEVLVDFYFYPTFVRFFKQRPRLRLAFATFMAAGVGNFLFHFMMANRNVVDRGILGTMIGMQTYAFYCLLLSAGIIVSQLRDRKHPPGAGWLRAQFLPSLGVAAFFALLSFFDGTGRHDALIKHLAFLAHICGVDRWL